MGHPIPLPSSRSWRGCRPELPRVSLSTANTQQAPCLVSLIDIVSLESSKNSSCPPQTPTAAKAIENFSRVTASLREAPVATLDPAIVAWGAPYSAERDSARAFLQTCTVPWPRHCAVPPEVSPFMIQPGLQWDLSKHGDSVTTSFDGISPESGRGSRRLASLLSPPLTVT